MSSQKSDNPYRAPVGAPINSARKQRSPLLYFLIEAGISLALSALVLDGGQVLRITAIAVIVQLGVILSISFRRGSNWTNGDLFLMKWGLVFTLVAGLLIASFIGRFNVLAW